MGTFYSNASSLVDQMCASDKRPRTPWRFTASGSVYHGHSTRPLGRKCSREAAIYGRVCTFDQGSENQLQEPRCYLRLAVGGLSSLWTGASRMYPSLHPAPKAPRVRPLGAAKRPV